MSNTFADLGFQPHSGSDDFADIGFNAHEDQSSAPAPQGGNAFQQFMNSPWSPVPGALKLLPTAGMVGGGILGAAAAAPETLGMGAAPGAVIGAGLGAGAGKSLENLGEKYLLGQDKTTAQVYKEPLEAAVGGAGAEMGGQIIGGAAKMAADTAPGQYVLQKAGNAATWATQKVGRIFAGVPEETTGRYIENPQIINSAVPRDEINDKFIELKSAADDKAVQAQEDLTNAKVNAAENRSDVGNAIQDERFQAGQSVQQAQQNLSNKTQVLRDSLKNSSLTGMAGDVNQAIGNLKQQVIKGSGEAYDILDNADGAVPTAPLIKILQGHIDPLMVNGVPIPGSSAQAIHEIQAMQSSLSQMGEEISLPQAKQIMQGLDPDIKWSNNPGKFSDQATNAFKSLRTGIDQSVKAQVPEYAEKMTEVAANSRLLNGASDAFGTPEKAISNLNNIASEKGQAVHLPIIDALGKATGQDLSTPVNDFLTKQKILNSPPLFQAMIDQTPEAQALASAQSKMSTISNPEYPRSIREDLNQPMNENISQAQAKLENAKGEQNLFKGITPNTVTAKTKQLNGANSYGAKSTFGPIDERYGTNFQQDIQARNDLDQFAKDQTRGSRGAVIGSVVGGGVGHFIAGAPGTYIGSSTGAMIGGAADKYAGPIFKAGIDATKSGAQLAGIAARNSTPLIGQGAMSMLPSSPPGGGAGQPPASGFVPPQVPPAQNAQSPKGGPDKWAQDGIQTLKGHVSDQDRQWLEQNKGAMLLDPKAQNLLISASQFQPGQKPLDDIMKHLKNRFKE